MLLASYYGFKRLNPAPSWPSLSSSYRVGFTSVAAGTCRDSCFHPWPPDVVDTAIPLAVPLLIVVSELPDGAYKVNIHQIAVAAFALVCKFAKPSKTLSKIFNLP